jgi:proteasome activator subunit 4
MITPDLSTLTLRDEQTTRPALPDDIANSTDQYILRLKKYALSVPYPVESYAKMLEMLDFILLRLTQCIEAKDYDPGFLQWDSMLT